MPKAKQRESGQVGAKSALSSKPKQVRQDWVKQVAVQVFAQCHHYFAVRQEDEHRHEGHGWKLVERCTDCAVPITVCYCGCQWTSRQFNNAQALLGNPVTNAESASTPLVGQVCREGQSTCYCGSHWIQADRPEADQHLKLCPAHYQLGGQYVARPAQTTNSYALAETLRFWLHCYPKIYKEIPSEYYKSIRKYLVQGTLPIEGRASPQEEIDFLHSRSDFGIINSDTRDMNSAYPYPRPALIDLPSISSNRTAGSDSDDAGHAGDGGNAGDRGNAGGKGNAEGGGAGSGQGSGTLEGSAGDRGRGGGGEGAYAEKGGRHQANEGQTDDGRTSLAAVSQGGSIEKGISHNAWDDDAVSSGIGQASTVQVPTERSNIPPWASGAQIQTRLREAWEEFVGPDREVTRKKQLQSINERIAEADAEQVKAAQRTARERAWQKIKEKAKKSSEGRLREKAEKTVKRKARAKARPIGIVQTGRVAGEDDGRLETTDNDDTLTEGSSYVRSRRVKRKADESISDRAVQKHLRPIF